MKKNLLTAMLGLGLIIFAASCSKDDNYGGGGTANTGIEGKWSGNYNNGLGGPINYFAITFQSGGSLVVNANSSATPDVANGNWYVSADSVRGSFTYLTGAGTSYSFAGKYSTSSNTIVGTLGLGANTAGAGVFSITRE